ncbi:MAG: radical SAM protein, partial [Planctomycetota bacterium]
MSEAVRYFHIMAKPVCGACNLNCTYCYYTAKPHELYPDVEKFMMSDEVLETYTREYLGAIGGRCEFAWQGGEPLLAGKDFFRKAIRCQEQYAAGNQAITNAMQTNGTLLDDEWCELLAENRFLVGISIDGPAQ